MKKDEFMRELRNNLEGKISKEDIDEVVYDYQDIFYNKKLEGSSEDEISDMLGSPASIARNILDDNRYESVNHENVSNENIWNMASMGKRLWAYLIDAVIICGLFTLVVVLPTNALFGATTSVEQVAVANEGIEMKGEMSTTNEQSNIGRYSVHFYKN